MRAEQKTDVKNSVGRMAFVILSVLIQAGWILLIVLRLNRYSWLIALISTIAAMVVVLRIYASRENSAYKILWIMLILAAPVMGLCLYLLLGHSMVLRFMTKRHGEIKGKLADLIAQDPKVLEEMDGQDRAVTNQSRYISNFGKYPVYRNTDVEFYGDASDGLEAQKKALSEAKTFIFMEYHAIEDSTSFTGIREILARKVKEGVEVRLLYDDVGSVGFISPEFIKRMEADGIQCRVFNPMVPMLHVFMNNRDHRKITVVDGKVGFTGGYNLADEYFNLTSPYGHWKDTGFRLTGAPVRSFTHMFLTFWNAFSLQKEEPMPMPPAAAAAEPAAQDGWVLSYYDSPLNSEATSNRLYIDLLSQATDYAWFFTPYLMLGDDLLDAMLAAAQRGVDVRIVMPGIPDKKLIFRMSRSFYQVLLTGGVKIYEYTPGFVHAKSLVCDDRAATVGTVNLDYRSLFLHFENNSLFYRGSIVARVKEDFLATQSQCRAVEACDMKRYSRRWIVDGVLRIFAPLC